MTATEIKTIRKSDYQNYLQKGIGYDQYKHQMAEDLLYNTDPRVKEYIHLNLHRMSRVEKTYSVNEALAWQVKKLTHKTYWLVLTGHWCGDAAQTLSAFHRVAELSHGMIELKMVYRDENPELMDAYLTSESRSIPKLIQMDAHYNVTGIWGPRPSEAQRLVKQLKSNPETAASYSTELHKWYANDKNRALESEITKLINRASMFCQDCFN